MGGSFTSTARRLGRYELGPELGHGGMATVHFALAKGPLGFSRPVALKRIHPMLAKDSALVDAIEDEARIASRVRHPGVVQLLDLLVDGDEVALVLEYVHGESLAALARAARERTRPIPAGVAAAIAADVLHGLHAAHVAVDEVGAPLGIVHRDVSPQNVIVGADGAARVLDFGIAKARTRAAVTRDGQIKGKLKYMAPEQLGGDASVESDVYAVGLVLWELLVGASPYDRQGDEGELLGLVLAGVSERPSARRAEIPEALEACVMRALAPREADRFPSAAAMAVALESTGALASRSEVAAFVAEIAGDVLEARGRVVALLERGLPAEADAPPIADEKTSAEPVIASARRAPPRRTVAGFVVAGIVLAVVVGGLYAARGGAAPEIASRRAASSPTPAPLPAAHEPERPVLVSAPPPAASSAPEPTPPSPSSPGRNRGKLRTVAPSGKVDCSVPYTVDAQGYRRYRRECFE
jgi:eukaryotic-like serine/threonine-protein kinase